MSDPVLAVGLQFRVMLTDAVAVIEAKLDEDRWRVSWSNTRRDAVCTSVAILGWIKSGDWIALGSASDWKRREYEVPKLEPLYSGRSFHVGIDLGGKDTTCLTVLDGNKVIAFARMANPTEMYQLGEACRPYEATVCETLDREIRAIADIFVRTVAYRERLLCLGNCGESVEKRPGEVSWVCAKCNRTRQRQVPIADQRWTPRPNAPSACCRIGGEMALDGKPCPLHREPWAPEFDTLDFLKP